MTDQPAAPQLLQLPGLSRELRRVAKAALNIGYGSRSNPESTLRQKQEIAARLEQLAGLIDVGLAKADAAGDA